LTYCTVQFLEKDPALATTIIKAMLRFWPKVNSPKEVMFLNELEEILDVIEPGQFTKICQPMFQQLVRCIVSPHFQIAERTLGMWRNQYIVNLITDNNHLILPVALAGIYQHSRSHWNRNIHNQVYQTLRFFVNVNEDVFDQCLSEFRHTRDLERKRRQHNSTRWSSLAKVAMTKAQQCEVPATVLQDISKSAVTDSKSADSGQFSSPVPTVNTDPGTDEAKDDVVMSEETPSGAATEQTTATAVDGTSPKPPADASSEASDATNGSVENSASKDPAIIEADAAAQTSPVPHLISKLDDVNTMASEMDEDEFILELDKLVDSIKAGEPESVMMGGMMLLDESDGSLIADDMLGAHGQNPGVDGYSAAQMGHHTGMDMESLDMQVDIRASGTSVPITLGSPATTAAEVGLVATTGAFHPQQHYMTAEQLAAVQAAAGQNQQLRYSLSANGELIMHQSQPTATPAVAVVASQDMAMGTPVHMDVSDVEPVPVAASTMLVQGSDTGRESADGSGEMDLSTPPPS
ncbi:serine/threonine-protein phosphatase 2A 56 kDa regulatory subunit delta isoform, partial [Linderina macrospora]